MTPFGDSAKEKLLSTGRNLQQSGTFSSTTSSNHINQLVPVCPAIRTLCVWGLKHLSWTKLFWMLANVSGLLRLQCSDSEPTQPANNELKKHKIYMMHPFSSSWGHRSLAQLPWGGGRGTLWTVCRRAHAHKGPNSGSEHGTFLLWGNCPDHLTAAPIAREGHRTVVDP